MRCILFVVFFFCTSLFSYAQQASVKTYTTPLAGRYTGTEEGNKYYPLLYNMEMPEPDADMEQVRLQAIKAEIHQMFPYRQAAKLHKTTSAAMPVVSIGFVADSLSGIPPDNYVAVSNHDSAVSVTNTWIAYHNSLTGAITGRKQLSAFSANVGLPTGGLNSQNYRYDPKIIYDQEADRFISIMLNGTDQNSWVVVGFSQTSSPSGAWNFYKFVGNYNNDSTWFDYPAIALTKDEFFFTGNKIKDNVSWQTGFTQSVIYQIRKSDGYNGDATLTYHIWDNINFGGQAIRNLFPVKGGSSLKGPEQYFLSNRNYATQNDTVFLVKIPDTLNSGNTNLAITPLVSNVNYGVPPDGRQKDTAIHLATNDGRVLGAYIEGTEIQFVSTTVVPATGGAGVYHGKITNVTTTPSLLAQIYAIDTLDFGYPNISYAGNFNGSNNSIISFDYSGPQTYPGLGAMFYDGTQYSGMLNVKGGDTSIKVLVGTGGGPATEQRWGDYTGSQPDWSSIGAVWIEGIFGHKHYASTNYGNYMARLTSPYWTSVPVIQPLASNSALFPNPAEQFINIDFKLKQNQALHFVIYDMQGRMVDKLLDQYCTEGMNRIQFNIAPLAIGTYILKAMDEKGIQVMVHQFIRK
ncbi:MAG: T9SS type A sorting domain-containing protein [Bacteroidota bacterium]